MVPSDQAASAAVFAGSAGGEVQAGFERRRRDRAGRGDAPAIFDRLAQTSGRVMSGAAWKITQCRAVGEQGVELMIFSCSARSLRKVASHPNRSQAEKAL
jgi:hypothetical protein